MNPMRRWTAALAVLAAVAPTQAWARYPDKPVRLVVPFPAGGSTDVLARAIAKAMSGHLGQQVVVDNKAGAGTILGMDNVAKSPADGYHIVLATATAFCIHPHVYKKLPYRFEDFTPIGSIAEAPVIMVGANKVPANTLAELVTALRSSTDAPIVATTGKGAFSHLTAAMFFTAIGVKFNDVPYKGEAPALQDLIAGHVPLYFGNLPGTLPYVTAGRIKSFAVTSTARSPVAPNIPTFTESGRPEVVATAWFGLAAPKGVPNEAIAALGDALRKALEDKEVQAQFAKDGATTRPLSQKDFADLIKRDHERWGEVVRASKIEPMEL